MANEIGYFVVGSGSAGLSTSPSEILFGHSYTAVSGDAVTAVRIRGQASSAAGSATTRVVLVDTASNEVKFAQDVGVTYSGGLKDEQVAVNWSLVAGVTYAISVVEVTADAFISFSNSAAANSERANWSAAPPVVGSIGTPDGYTGGSVPMVAADVVQSSSPTITDVNTDESVYPGESFTITGTGFGATQGAGGVDIDGVAQTVTAWGDTSITCTAVRGGNNYGTGKTLTVTTDAATTATSTVAQEAEPNTFAVTAASPNTTDDASLWTGLIDTATSNPITIVNGDQAWVKNPNNLTNLAVAADGTITADTEGDFVVQIWLASEGVWGSDQTVTFSIPVVVKRMLNINLSMRMGL